MYPAMHWCLQRLPQLKKRAYLARYLMPVEVPVEFMQDQALVDLHEAYRQLQVRLEAWGVRRSAGTPTLPSRWPLVVTHAHA